MSRCAGESSRSLAAITSLFEAFCQMLLSTRYVVTGQQSTPPAVVHPPDLLATPHEEVPPALLPLTTTLSISSGERLAARPGDDDVPALPRRHAGDGGRGREGAPV